MILSDGDDFAAARLIRTRTHLRKRDIWVTGDKPHLRIIRSDLIADSILYAICDHDFTWPARNVGLQSGDCFQHPVCVLSANAAQDHGGVKS